MINCVYGHDEIVARFVAQMTANRRGFPRGTQAIGLVDGDQLVAGVVFSWNPDAGVVDMVAAAIPGCRWMSRRTLKALLAYPFQQLQCQMVTGLVEVEHTQLLRQLAALGFSMIRIPRIMGRDKDAMLCSLTAEDWAAHRINRPPPVKYEPLLEEAA